jgi:hypothetical protein
MALAKYEAFNFCNQEIDVRCVGGESSHGHSMIVESPNELRRRNDRQSQIFSLRQAGMYVSRSRSIFMFYRRLAVLQDTDELVGLWACELVLLLLSIAERVER